MVYKLFKTIQEEKRRENSQYCPLNIACVFSPPPNVSDNPDSNRENQQTQEDLLQEKIDNQEEPEQKKAALISIINDYTKIM
ncbi:hypothetical protein [Thioflexithrix psekupsensis]|uniref:Uncharacterized protein n=1 Tax=Thioflexithrix psekupsensis TaxID=1570016 RepID=A0A251XAG7_9GAMM|nr:hypothetical protein [Thioflexithrix psekupsensis]OUD15422.1 hypothetical protein TPSD3_02520 [Thioflexithrix psekupsensis]